MTKQMARCLMMLTHPESTFVASHGVVAPVGTGVTGHAGDQENTDGAYHQHSHEHEFLLGCFRSSAVLAALRLKRLRLP
jgi:hypothetical protein